jgi:hypothetical protein
MNPNIHFTPYPSNVAIVNANESTSADDLLKSVLVSAASEWVRADSRNGPVLRAPSLFITSYSPGFVPVMQSPIRGANPFLHYVESFYYLCGRNDVKLMSFFAKQMDAYSDDGETLWGSYGARWRNHFGHDQLRTIIQELRANPSTRRCVLQMWDGAQDLNVAIGGGKDVPCNVTCTFDTAGGQLNMSVYNRSNDLIWGAYGANMVHFNIMHSYVAAMANMPKGVYHQISSNTHIYLENPVTARMLSGDPEAPLTTPYEEEDTRAQVSNGFLSSQKAYEGLFTRAITDDEVNANESSLACLNRVFSRMALLIQEDPGMQEPTDWSTLLMTGTPLDRLLPVHRDLCKFIYSYILYKMGQLEEALMVADELALNCNPFFVEGARWLHRRTSVKKANQP